MNVSVKQPPELEKRKLTSLQQRLHNFSAGSLGEQRAIQFLQNKNFQIVDTNVRFGLHEVDIIAIAPLEDKNSLWMSDDASLGSKNTEQTKVTNSAGTNPGETLIFCEVKSRSTSFFGDPSRAVSTKKLKSMQVVAREYLRTHHWVGEYRFDVIAVLPDEIEHFENVTWWK